VNCDARIRPFPHAIEIACEKPLPHMTHQGTLNDYAFPGSSTTVSWAEDDRRTFHGDWPGSCETPGCTLPAGHPRRHAL
jgi:hypothetical protein